MPKNKLKTQGKDGYCDKIISVKFNSEKETERVGMNMGPNTYMIRCLVSVPTFPIQKAF
jgi:hypothetical protein